MDRCNLFLERQTNIVKVSVHPKLINRFNTIATQVLTFFTQLKKTVPKSIGTRIEPE